MQNIKKVQKYTFNHYRHRGIDNLSLASKNKYPRIKNKDFYVSGKAL